MAFHFWSIWHSRVLAKKCFCNRLEIESVGGSLNAYTSENTFYYAKVMKEDLELAIGLISDIIQNSVMMKPN